MQGSILHQHNGQNFWLSPFRCIYWEQQKMLIMADLHLGKLGHFRKNGFAIPGGENRDLYQLEETITLFKPDQLVIIGDMFHSKLNHEIDQFSIWKKNYHLKMILVKGNHDLLPQTWYDDNNIELRQEYIVDNYGFIHDLGGENNSKLTNDEKRVLGMKNSSKQLFSNKLTPEAPYYFTGHLHPGVNIIGRSKERVTLPCFYFGAQFAILPAFSHLAGVSIIKSTKNADVYAILNDGLIQV